MALQTRTFEGSTGRPGVWTWKIVVTENYYQENGVNSTNKVQITIDEYLGRPSSQSSSYFSGSATLSFGAAGQSHSQPYSGDESGIGPGSWRYLASHTFVVSDTGTINNPTTITVSGSMSGASFSPYSATASGTMSLTPLHQPPTINNATMTETNSVLTALSVPNTTIVRHLSKKTITLSGTPYEGATLKYRLRHLNSDYALPSSTTFQDSSTFTNVDYTTHDVAISNDGKAQLIQDIGDDLNGLTTDWVYVDISGTAQKPNGIAYTKPTLERTSTTIKRKSGNGVNLTDNKAELNLVGTIYKVNDVIGNNNTITQIGYKIWERDASEPSSYTTLTPTVDSDGNVSVSGVEISGVDFTKVYYYKFILKDYYNYDYTIEDSVPLGQPTWTEYKDRVDFKEITIGQNKVLSQLGKSIYVKMSNAQTISRNTTTKVNTDTVNYNTSTALTFDTINNTVVIGKGVSSVLVNCRYSAWNISSSPRYIYIYKNGVAVAFNERAYSQTMETTTVVPVQENDYIEMYCYNEQSDTFSITASENQTFLQVTILG